MLSSDTIGPRQRHCKMMRPSTSTRSARTYCRRRPLIENRGRSSLQKYEGEHRHVEAIVEGGVNYDAFASEATAYALEYDSRRCTATIQLLRPRAGERATTVKSIRISLRPLLQLVLSATSCAEQAYLTQSRRQPTLIEALRADKI